MEAKKLRELIHTIFDRKRLQCSRCYYAGDERLDDAINFPIGTHYDKNDNYTEQSLTICPVCKEIF